MTTPIEELVQGRSFKCQGEGELRLQPEQPGLPEGPGRVRFDLRYAPTQDNDLLISLRLRGLDEGAREIFAWRLPGNGRTVLPRYDLSGTVDVGGEKRPVSMEFVTLSYPFGIVGDGSHQDLLLWGQASTVTVGNTAGAHLDRARMLIPNLLARAGFEAQGLRVRLSWVRDDEQSMESVLFPTPGKVLLDSFLDLERLEGSEGDAVRLAVEAFGVFLSFHAGRAVYPLAWEGETETSQVWGITASAGGARLPSEERKSCVPNYCLGPFLKRAWEAWLELTETQRLRLTGVVNVYQDMLAAQYPIQKIALTAMFLERFRELVLGSSELLQTLANFSKNKRQKAVNDLRKDLKKSIASNRHLDDSQKDVLRQSLEANPVKVQDLFRKTFKDSLLELYVRADLEVDKGKLDEYIKHRNFVLHGTWDSDVKGGTDTFMIAEYGLELLERLVVRFFGYEGPFYERTRGADGYLARGEPNW